MTTMSIISTRKLWLAPFSSLKSSSAELGEAENHPRTVHRAMQACRSCRAIATEDYPERQQPSNPKEGTYRKGLLSLI